jgi:hypothetical protein
MFRILSLICSQEGRSDLGICAHFDIRIVGTFRFWFKGKFSPADTPCVQLKVKHLAVLVVGS